MCACAMMCLPVCVWYVCVRMPTRHPPPPHSSPVLAIRRLSKHVFQVKSDPASPMAPPEEGASPTAELATAIRAEQALAPVPGLDALEKAYPALAAAARTALGYKALLSTGRPWQERASTPAKGGQEGDGASEHREEQEREVRGMGRERGSDKSRRGRWHARVQAPSYMHGP